jgi:hypothetical protein
MVLKIDSPIHENLVKIIFDNKISNTNTENQPYYALNKGWLSFYLLLRKRKNII